MNPEIANSITKAEAKDGEREGNKNDEFLCEADQGLDPQRIDPRRGEMLVNPLRAADQVKR
ncbi:MAG: hypothetical protein DMF07_00725 [Verrucomicrobia bacterium]|nr:MAG: hypothetical protein DMF07_00725 [Verrucomicrobiota bacterium]